MQYCINITTDIDVIGDVMPDKEKTWIPCQMSDIAHITCDQIVHAEDMMTFRQKTVAQMRTYKSSSACDENSHCTPLFVILPKTSNSLPEIIEIGYEF